MKEYIVILKKTVVQYDEVRVSVDDHEDPSKEAMKILTNSIKNDEERFFQKNSEVEITCEETIEI